MLRAGGLDPKTAARGLETIERNSLLQTRLVDELLDVSRIITGKLRLEVRPMDLGPVIAAGRDAMRPAEEAKNLEMEVEIDPSVGLVSGDPDRLQQVVWNLLSNAVKFTPPGGRVRVRLERAGTVARITVSDTGLGIEPEMLPHIFERFRQVDGSTTRRHGGLGLGLAIVRHLVELHGGTVHASSDGKGKGATFTVDLPVLASRSDAPRAESPRPEQDGTISVERLLTPEGLKVLAVDDDLDTRALLAVTLQRCGAEVKAVASAAEALETLQRWQPDVLVCDIGMPGVDGYDFIRQVRALAPERGRDIPAIALTAFAGKDDRLQALEAGYQKHVPKPVEPTDLVAAVASLAESSKKARG
jgi:CheY-like chemotaxis protein/anti-sigma regulatory factor (Ser/Thr protein kinase)